MVEGNEMELHRSKNILNSNTCEDIFSGISCISKAIGFDFLFYETTVPTRRRYCYKDCNSPHGWSIHFEVIKNTFFSRKGSFTDPLIWGTDLLEKGVDQPSPLHIQAVELRFGVSIATSLNSISGTIFTFGKSDDTEYLSTYPLPEDIERLRWLTHFGQKSLLQVENSPFDRIKPSSLTEREIECLQWVAAGKSSWEAGVILNCSERTVNFHINNAMRKLDVSKRSMAVAKALNLGMIA